jgi:ribosomal protein S6--L-glutamate ligase
MRMLVLSRNAALYSTARLIRAARARGHEVDVLDPVSLQFAALPGMPGVLVDGSPLPKYDVVLPRIGASMTSYGATAVAALTELGLPVLNGANGILLARDKLRSLQRLAAHRVKVPRTVALRSLGGLQEALALVGGCPVVVKLQNGTHGVGTMLAESEKGLFSLCETLAALGQQLVLQEFVKAARGRDIRAFVVGGKVMAAMLRTAAPGEFRSNIHRGGTGEAVTLNRRFTTTALRAAAAIDLEIAGVDILDADGTPLVIEVNCSPGLEGIEQATEINIADAVIARAEKLATRRPARRRPRRSRG